MAMMMRMRKAVVEVRKERETGKGPLPSLDVVRPCGSLTAAVSLNDQPPKDVSWNFLVDKPSFGDGVPEQAVAILEDVALGAAVGSTVTVNTGDIELRVCIKVADQKALLPAVVTAHTHINLAHRFKQNGVTLFKSNEVYWAARSFSKCIRHLVLLRELHQRALTDELSALYDAAYANLAMCHLRLGRPHASPDNPPQRFFFHAMASHCSDKVLEANPDHAKALFRKAKAERINKNPDTAIALLKRLLSTDPGNKAAVQELRVAEAAAVRRRKEEAARYAGMFASSTSTSSGRGKASGDSGSDSGGGGAGQQEDA